MKLFDKIVKIKKDESQNDLTGITRTEVIKGLSIPAIIKNMQYYFTDLQIYSDGLISCWEMVDLEMFKEKLNHSWVVPSIPDGESLSIFGLGYWEIKNGHWVYDKESYFNYIYSLVKRLNPTLENLYSYNGCNTISIGEGKCRMSKHAIPIPKPYYYDDLNSFLPEMISGEKFAIFYKDEKDTIYLSELSIYKNGHVEITKLPHKRTFNFEDIRTLIDNRTLISELKEGEQISIVGLGSFTIKSGEGTDINLKYDEFVDKYNELKGGENCIDKCSRLFDEYKLKPTIILREELKEAYEAIPLHKRIFVGTMDTKDYEVRLAVYGDIVKKEFEEENGYKYPYNDLPTPIKDN